MLSKMFMLLISSCGTIKQFDWYPKVDDTFLILAATSLFAFFIDTMKTLMNTT